MGVPTFISANASEGNALNSPGNWPTTQNNDVMFVYLALSNTTSPVLPSAPSGWAQILSTPQCGTVASNTILGGLYWKRVGASEAAPTFSGITGQRFFLAVQYRGCPTSGDPFDVSASDMNNSASTTISLDIGTTTETDCSIYYFLTSSIGTSNTFSGQTNSNLSGITEDYDTGAGESTMGGWHGSFAAGGAVGTSTTTCGSALSVFCGIAVLSTTSTPLASSTPNFFSVF